MSQKQHVICFNGGSSSIKISVKEVNGADVETIVDFNCQGLGMDHGYIDVKTADGKETIDTPMKDHKTALTAITSLISERYPELNIVAAGHRVVHGGPEFTETALIDEKVMKSIEEYSSLAPLHNPANLQIIEAALADSVFGKVPNAAIFDTQFHAEMPRYVRQYGVPSHWLDDYKIQRYGFHGASYTYISGRFAELNGLSAEETNCVIAHLGNGCSIAKVEGGKGTDTSMGTTPLEGLIMGTRSGDIDPGALELMANNLNTDIKEIIRILNKESGLLGLYNKNGLKDMNKIRMEAEKGDIEAEVTIQTVAYRVAKYFSAYIGTMENPKGIVFTGGIGENEGYFRKKVMGFMKLYNWKIDENTIMTRNEEVIVAESGLIPGLKAWVIPTDEEKVFALEAMKFAK